MPPLLERLRRSLAGSQLTTLESQVTDLQSIAARLAEAYNAGSYELPPTELVRQLREYDTSLISDLVDQMGWEAVSGYGGYSEGERQRAVNDATRMAKYSTLAKWTINLWTFYGLSSNVDIVPDDDSRDEDDPHSAQSVWNEFWDADRNQAIIAKDRLDELSRWLLIKGERFFAFYADRMDGETTIRSLRPEEIAEIYTNPDDSSDIWFYKRQWTDATGKSQALVYPDWEIFFNGKVNKCWSLTQSTYSTAKGLELASRPQTDVCILFVPFTQLDEDSVRGWPLLAPHGTAWLRAQRDFMQDRAAVTRAVAAFVRRYKVTGGSRAVDSIRSTLMSTLQSGSTAEANYPALAGSSEILNRAIDAQDLPLQTGAVDAKTDSEMFAWIALLAGGVFPHYAGMGDAYRLATATSMERPLQLQFSLYRNQLGAMFRKIVRIVLQFHERYNKQVTYNTYTVSISLDRLVEVDLPVISSALTQINDSIIQPLIESNSLTQEARNTILASMLRLVFQSLGMEDASEIVNETIFTEPEEQVVPEPEEPEKPEEPTSPEPEEPEEPEETTPEEAAAPPTEDPTITDEDIENWLAWVEKLDPDLMALVLADEEEMREGGSGSGWFAPPKGTHGTGSQGGNASGSTAPESLEGLEGIASFDRTRRIGDNLFNLPTNKEENVDWESGNIPSESIKDDICQRLSEKTGLPYETVNTFIRQWAESSNDTDMRSLQIQIDASKQFDVSLSDWQKERIAERMKPSLKDRLFAMEAKKPLYDSETQQTILKAMYEETQSSLGSLGIGAGDKVLLFRGTSIPGLKPASDDVIKIKENAISSWSLNEDVARDFAISNKGFVLVAEVPRSAILSTARTGFGCVTEAEVTVLGIQGDARIGYVYSDVYSHDLDVLDDYD